MGGGRKWERDQGEKQIGEREEIEEDAFTEKGREGKRGEDGRERGRWGREGNMGEREGNMGERGEHGGERGTWGREGGVWGRMCNP